MGNATPFCAVRIPDNVSGLSSATFSRAHLPGPAESFGTMLDSKQTCTGIRRANQALDDEYADMQVLVDV